MANIQTVKNTIKKLENKQAEENKYPHCGVITVEEYEKLTIPDAPEGGNKRRVGYLVVPGRKSEEEWGAKHG